VAIVAKPQLRKPTAVAERRPVAAGKPAAKPVPSKATPQRRRLSAVLPPKALAPIEGRTEGMTTWVRDVRSELRKCAWPTREETMRLTTVIIAISLIVGIVLGLFDMLFARLMTGLLA
jgi:preprotein translocase subunit SecE